MIELLPESPGQVQDAVKGALADRRRLAVEGEGSKRGWGRPVDVEARLSLRRVTGVLAYEPDELVLTALAGTPMTEIAAALTEKRQHLAFEPGNLAPLWGGENGAGTLAGTLACNLSGPRRPFAGAARDHFLGFQAVNGAGEAFKAGGKVVKNVTGYDLSKLMAGSFGTLAVLTEVTVKVMPAPRKQRTALFAFDTLEPAHDFLIRAQQGEFELDGAALFPDGWHSRLGIERLSGLGRHVVACRMTGTAASVEARCQALRAIGIGAGEELHSMNSALLWSAIRDLRHLTENPEARIWRLSIPPSDGALVLSRVLAAFPGAEWLMDWGGGLVWVAIAADHKDEPSAIRGAIAAGRGHASLLRGSEALRAAIDPLAVADGTANLARRVKEAFDPAGLLNPCRLHRDW